MRAPSRIALLAGALSLLGACEGRSSAQAAAPEPAPGVATPGKAAARTTLDPDAPKQLAIFFEVSNRGELDPCG